MPSPSSLVTVVIPAVDEVRFIAGCLRSVCQQTHTALQVVVVDGGSRDGTLDEVRRQMAEDGRIELAHNARRNIPSSLNIALARARGDWLVRVDAHSTVDPRYVELAVRRLEEGRWGGVGGRKDGVGVTSTGRAIAAAMASRFGVGNSVYHHGTSEQTVDHIPFGAYPTDLVRARGGWDETLSANEDYEFDLRVRGGGDELLFDPRMRIDWHCRQSIRDLARQYHRYGRGKVDVARLHPEAMRPRHLLPPALVAYLVGDLLVNLRRPGRMLLGAAPYALAVLAASVATSRGLTSRGDRLRVPAAFAAMHLGWGAGFWSGVGSSIGGAGAGRVTRSR